MYGMTFPFIFVLLLMFLLAIVQTWFLHFNSDVLLNNNKLFYVC